MSQNLLKGWYNNIAATGNIQLHFNTLSTFSGLHLYLHSLTGLDVSSSEKRYYTFSKVKKNINSQFTLRGFLWWFHCVWYDYYTPVLSRWVLVIRSRNQQFITDCMQVMKCPPPLHPSSSSSSSSILCVVTAGFERQSRRWEEQRAALQCLWVAGWLEELPRSSCRQTFSPPPGSP